MYLIIQRSNGKTYAYFEDKKHFKVAEKDRRHLTRIKMTILDQECDISQHGDNIYMVIPVKKRNSVCSYC